MGYKANHYRYINSKVVMMIKPSCGNCLNNEHLYCNMVTRMWMCRILTFSGKHGSLKPKNLSLEDDIPFRRSSFFLGFSVATLGDTDLPYLQNRIWFDGVDIVIFAGFHVKFQGCIFKPPKNSEEKSRVLKAQHLSGRSCCEKRGRNRNFSRRWSSTRSVALSIGHCLGESWLVSPWGYPDPAHV